MVRHVRQVSDRSHPVSRRAASQPGRVARPVLPHAGVVPGGSSGVPVVLPVVSGVSPKSQRVYPRRGRNFRWTCFAASAGGEDCPSPRQAGGEDRQVHGGEDQEAAFGVPRVFRSLQGCRGHAIDLTAGSDSEAESPRRSRSRSRSPQGRSPRVGSRQPEHEEMYEEASQEGFLSPSGNQEAQEDPAESSPDACCLRHGLPCPSEFVALFREGSCCQRAVFQLEQCPTTGRFHFQGCLKLSSPRTLDWVIKFFEKLCHVNCGHCDGSWESNEKYCSKEATRVFGPWEFGDPPATQGQRTDLDDACRVALEEGIKSCASRFPGTYAKFFRGIKAFVSAVKENPRDQHFIPWPWQASLLELLDADPDDRSILWIYDPDGDNGKSRLARHLVLERGAVILSGRVQDMCYSYNNERIVVFNVTRSGADFSDHFYTVAEMLKDGILNSPKYESEMKVFNPPHVIFFSNNWPQKLKWTKDRLKAFKLSPDRHLVPVLYDDVPDIGSRSPNFRVTADIN